MNGAPQNTFVPGVIELAERLKSFIGGDDLKSGQTKLKSVFAEFGEQSQATTSRRVPKEFRKAAFDIVSASRNQLDGNEVRAMAANTVASPVLQVCFNWAFQMFEISI